MRDLVWPLNTPLITSKQGMFGAVRKHDIHTGIDLYTDEGAEVYAMERGEVLAIEDFTGPPKSPWWLPTKSILVQGDTGVIVYGEVEPCVEVNQWVNPGQLIAHVIPVLPPHKARPDIPGHSRWMLHLELHDHWTMETVEWSLNTDKPSHLKDPTSMVYAAYVKTLQFYLK